MTTAKSPLGSCLIQRVVLVGTNNHKRHSYHTRALKITSTQRWMSYGTYTPWLTSGRCGQQSSLEENTHTGGQGPKASRHQHSRRPICSFLPSHAVMAPHWWCQKQKGIHLKAVCHAQPRLFCCWPRGSRDKPVPSNSEGSVILPDGKHCLQAVVQDCMDNMPTTKQQHQQQQQPGIG